MKKNLRVLIAVAVMASVSFGDGYLTGNSPNLTGITIKSYFLHDYYGLVLVLSKDISYNPYAVTDLDKVLIPYSHPHFKELNAMAIGAFLNGQDIGFYSNGSQITPHWGGSHTLSKVRYMWLNK